MHRGDEGNYERRPEFKPDASGIHVSALHTFSVSDLFFLLGLVPIGMASCITPTLSYFNATSKVK
jgi:hypothetical protein